jgi:hypothetical protein
MTDAREARGDVSPDLTAYYRQVLDTHRPEGKRRVCSVCDVARCPDWLDAYDKLAVAGQLMATSDRWQSQLSEEVPWRQ